MVCVLCPKQGDQCVCLIDGMVFAQLYVCSLVPVILRFLSSISLPLQIVTSASYSLRTEECNQRVWRIICTHGLITEQLTTVMLLHNGHTKDQDTGNTTEGKLRIVYKSQHHSNLHIQKPDKPAHNYNPSRWRQEDHVFQASLVLLCPRKKKEKCP